MFQTLVVIFERFKQFDRTSLYLSGLHLHFNDVVALFGFFAVIVFVDVKWVLQIIVLIK